MRKVALVLGLLGLAYGLGIATAHYNTKPYRAVLSSPTVASVMDWVRGRGDPKRTAAPQATQNRSWNSAGMDGEILKTAFNRPLIAPDRQINPPVRSLADLRGQLDGLVVDSRDPATFYERIVEGAVTAGSDRIDLDYTLGGPRRAHAYRLSATGPEARSDCAVLAVPGTGENEAYKMASRGQTTYQKTIVDVGIQFCDVYVLIRPNQSIYAIHDGRNRLDDSYVFNYLLNRGGSYTAAYVADALALAKHLRAVYARYAIAGLSQGGMATTFLSVLASPDAAVVASGYSVLLDRVEPAAPNQFVIPGSYPIYDPANVENWLAKSRTRVLFTYGRQETHLYGIEARDRVTCRRFERFANVSCAVHDGGHVYPEAALRQFLRDSLHP